MASRTVGALALLALIAPACGQAAPAASHAVTVTIECMGLIDGSLVNCRALGSQPKSAAAEQVGVMVAALRKGKPPDGWPVEGKVVTMSLPIEPPEDLAMTPPPLAAVIYTIGDLTAQPSRAQIDQVYPPPARAARIGGAVQMRCRVRSDGGLYGCAVAGESPAGQGFGAAAVSLQGLFSMRPKAVDGREVGGETTVPVVFRPPGE